ncbi:YjfK family protein, partial [Vibrio sp. 10N.261.45.A7]
IEISPLLLKLTESDLTIEGAAPTQVIQAVGVVDLDDCGMRLVRYYTDDEGYLQVLQSGTGDDGVIEVSLWYFYDSKPIDTQTTWDNLLQNQIVTPNRKYDLEGTEFEEHWDNEKPVALTEVTYHRSGKTTETDQFSMLYSRTLDNGKTEELLVAGEEKSINNELDRSVIRVTGFQLNSAEFEVVA